MAHIVG